MKGNEMSELTDALRSGQQCDEDGVMCIVSRQACHQAADKIERLERIIGEIWELFYGQNMQVANWHQNGELEPIDTFFECSDWAVEMSEGKIKDSENSADSSSADREVYEVLESEAWEDHWNDVGLYWTEQQAEAEVDRRRKEQRAESSLPDDEFNVWWKWTIRKKKLFGSSR